MQLPGLTIGIVADDLTGASDTALQFFKAGCSTRVVLDLKTATGQTPSPEELAAVQAWSINTESRHLDPREAVGRVRRAVALLRDQYGAEHFYKKMDSTLRGHVAQECLAVLDELKGDCAIIAPAYPQEGRRTVGGYQLVRGIPVEQTEVARDPLCPVRISHLPTLLGETSKPSLVGRVELSTVMHGAGPLVKALSDCVSDGKKLIVVDACTPVDLEQIALAIETLRKTAKVLPCGSAGLAQALSRHWPCQLRQPAVPLSHRQQPILIVAGSNTATTRNQVLQLLDHYPYYGESSNLDVFNVEPARILGETGLDDLADEVVAALDGRNTTVISTSFAEENLARTHELAQSLGISPEQAAQKAMETLAVLAQRVIAAHPDLTLVLCGGETAAQVCRTLGMTSLKVLAEAEPSIPLLLDGPEGAGRWVITKSGNFGSPMALANIVKVLKAAEVPATPGPIG